MQTKPLVIGAIAGLFLTGVIAVGLGRVEAKPPAVTQMQLALTGESEIPIEFPGYGGIPAIKAKVQRIEDTEYGVVCYFTYASAVSVVPALSCLKK